MPDLNTEKSLVNSAIFLRDSFQSNNAINTYIAAANHIPFEDDDNPPNPTNSEFELTYDISRKIIFGKQIEPQDISLAIKYHPWISGTVYAAYDDKDPDLHTKKFYCVSKEGSFYSVFKCLYNNRDHPSTYMPKFSETNIIDEFYRTNDDYVWKLMYTIPESDFQKFSVAGRLFPINDNPVARQYAANGAINTILVEEAGSGYTTYISGSFRALSISGNNLIHSIQSDDTLSANTDFYKYCGLYIKSGTGLGQLRQIEEYIVTGSDRRIVLKQPFQTLPDYSSKFDIAPFVEITGDGKNAQAVVSINTVSNTVHSIEMVNVGRDYSDVHVAIVANPAVMTANNAVCRGILSPQGGHGADIQSELFGKAVVFSSEFAGTEGNRIPIENDYRTVALYQNPVFANTVLTVDSVSGFMVDQMVRQDTGLVARVTGVNLDGAFTIRLGDIQGNVDANTSLKALNANSEVTATSNVVSVDRDLKLFDNRSAYAVEPITPLNQFIQDERIYQDVTNAYGYLHSIDNGTMYLTNVVGSFSISDFTIGIDQVMRGERSGAVAKVNGYLPPDLVPYRGKCLYINTTTPIERNPAQAERIKLVIEL